VEVSAFNRPVFAEAVRVSSSNAPRRGESTWMALVRNGKRKMAPLSGVGAPVVKVIHPRLIRG
jgi:hypothetical protein